jgi:hypothetical protein
VETKVRKGTFKGTALYLSKAQRQRLKDNYGADAAAIQAAIEGSPSGLRDAIEWMGDRERPKGAAKPATSFAAKVEANLNAVDSLGSDLLDTLGVDKKAASAKPAKSLEDTVQENLISDWGRVRNVLLGGSREGTSAPTAGSTEDAQITTSPTGRIQLTTYTGSAQMYITYNVTVDDAGKITGLQYAYAEPRDYALGDTEKYTPMTEAQVRDWMYKYA